MKAQSSQTIKYTEAGVYMNLLCTKSKDRKYIEYYIYQDCQYL